MRQRLFPRPDCQLRNWVRFVQFALLATAPLLAQNAELSGLVTDPSRLVVQGARVTVQNPGTAAIRTASSVGS